MPKRTVNLQFPLAGVNRAVGFQSQPPYTTFDANNVRPDATLEGRARGGSRPGLANLYGRYAVTSESNIVMNGLPTNTNLGAYSRVDTSSGAGTFSGVAPFDFGNTIVTTNDEPVYNSSTNTTTVDRLSGVTLQAAMVGGRLIYSDSTNEYAITAISGNEITVTADASGESHSSTTCFIVWSPSDNKNATLKFDTSGNVYDILCSDSSFGTTCYVFGDATQETTNNDTMVLTKYSGQPVRLLGTVREGEDSGVNNWQDPFEYTVTTDTDLTDLSENWSTLTDTNTQDIPIDDTEEEITGSLLRPQSWASGYVGTGYGTSGNNNNDAASGNAYVNLSHSLTLSSTFRATCIPSVGQTESSVNVHYLYAWMDNTTPDPWTDGLSIWTYITGGPASTNAKRYIGITERSSNATAGSFQQLVFSGNVERDQGLLIATIEGQNVTVRWVSNLADTSFTYVTANAPNTSYNRIGLGLFGETCNASGGTLFTPRSFTECPKFSAADFAYRLATGASYRQRLLSSVNQKLYATGGDAVFSDITSYTGSGGAVTLADNRIYGVELGGRFWIADDEGVIQEDDGGTVSSNVLDDAGVSDWTTNVSVYDTAIELFNHDNSGNGVYRVSAVVAGNVTLADSPADTTSSTDWRIYRTPKIYDPVTDTLYSWLEENKNAGSNFDDLTEAGTMPLGCPLIARYNGRIVLAGAPTARQIWYMSRQNNPLDWDYSQNDVQAAVAATSTEVGVIGDPLTALIPYLDDYLIFACADSMWVLRGDPLLGGRILNMSPDIGCIGAKAWCFTDSGTLYFMSRNGLYSVAPGRSIDPQEVTEDRIPAEFDSLTENDFVEMAYDQEGRGIHIFVKRQAGGKTAWWWDQDTNGFWPATLSSDHFPSATYSNGIDELGRNVALVGGEDSFIRAFNSSSFDDDGVALNAYVYIGPFRAAAGGDTDGMVQALIAVLAEESDNVTWEIYRGDTAEEATKSTSVFDSGTWSLGRNYHSRPRCRGGAFVVKVKSPTTPAGAWAFETITAKLESLGMLRKRD